MSHVESKFRLYSVMFNDPPHVSQVASRITLITAECAYASVYWKPNVSLLYSNL